MKKLLYGLLIVSTMQNVSLHGANLTSDEVKEILNYNIQNNSIHSFGENYILNLLRQLPEAERAIYTLNILNHYQETNRIHEFNSNNLYFLLSYLPEGGRAIYALNILNHYQEINKFHELNDLCPLLYFIPEVERATYASNILDHYQKINKFHKLNNLHSPLNCLPQAEQITYASNILDHYQKTNSVHELRNQYLLLCCFIPQAERIKYTYTIINCYNHKKTLFKYNFLLRFVERAQFLPKLLFNYPPHLFTQELASIDQNYHRQLHMFYIRKIIEESNFPVESSFFSEELLKPLLLEDIIAIIEYIHESTNVCGKSMEKVRPLCQAYLMHCEDLPNSMPIEYFTDLFSPFRTQTSSLTEAPDSSDTPQKIQELYAQYKYTNIIGNTIIVSRDEQPSVE